MMFAKGTPGHTPGTAYPWSIPFHPQMLQEFRNINCWLGVWGMLQGSVGKFLDVLEEDFLSTVWEFLVSMLVFGDVHNFFGRFAVTFFGLVNIHHLTCPEKANIISGPWATCSKNAQNNCSKANESKMSRYSTTVDDVTSAIFFLQN